MNMVKVKTAELEGAPLDWAVAVIEGHDVIVHGVGTYRYDKRGGIHCCKYGCTFGPRSLTSDSDEYSPSTDWSQGGPLIEKYRVSIIYSDEECDPRAWTDDTAAWHGPTPLIAACRAIVAARQGGVVEVPGELVGDWQ